MAEKMAAINAAMTEDAQRDLGNIHLTTEYWKGQLCKVLLQLIVVEIG